MENISTIWIEINPKLLFYFYYQHVLLILHVSGNGYHSMNKGNLSDFIYKPFLPQIILGTVPFNFLVTDIQRIYIINKITTSFRLLEAYQQTFHLIRCHYLLSFPNTKSQKTGDNCKLIKTKIRFFD